MEKRVLIVDDDEAIRNLMVEIVSDCGYQVDQVSSGFRAMVQVKEEKYDLILLDISMPGLNGIETIPYLLELMPGMQIVVVTGESDPKLHQEAVARGARSVVRKPFTPEVLMRAVDNTLGDRAQ